MAKNKKVKSMSLKSIIKSAKSQCWRCENVVKPWLVEEGYYFTSVKTMGHH